VNARENARIDVVIFKSARGDLTAIILNAHARLPGPVTGFELKAP
jgi:hypothetical protein